MESAASPTRPMTRPDVWWRCWLGPLLLFFAIPGYLHFISKYPRYLLWRCFALFPVACCPHRAAAPVLPASSPGDDVTVGDVRFPPAVIILGLFLIAPC